MPLRFSVLPPGGSRRARARRFLRRQGSSPPPRTFARTVSPWSLRGSRPDDGNYAQRAGHRAPLSDGRPGGRRRLLLPSHDASRPAAGYSRMRDQGPRPQSGGRLQRGGQNPTSDKTQQLDQATVSDHSCFYALATFISFPSSTLLCSKTLKSTGGGFFRKKWQKHFLVGEKLFQREICASLCYEVSTEQRRYMSLHRRGKSDLYCSLYPYFTLRFQSLRGMSTFTFSGTIHDTRRASIGARRVS